jgi:hypothetical protein
MKHCSNFKNQGICNKASSSLIKMKTGDKSLWTFKKDALLYWLINVFYQSWSYTYYLFKII